LAGDRQEEVQEDIFYVQHLSTFVDLILIIISYCVWCYRSTVACFRHLCEL